MSRRLIDTLARAGIEELSALVGRSVVNLLDRLGGRVSAINLSELIVGRAESAEALRDPEVRQLAILSLRRSEAADLCTLLGVNSDDPFVSLEALSFDRSEQYERILFAFFGIPWETREEGSQKPASVQVDPPYILFDHQRRASLRIRSLMSTEPRRVLLHMPTGSGKTRTAVTTIVDLLRTEPDGQAVVWLAHSEELCDQAFDELVKGWRALGSRDMRFYRHYGDHRVRDFREIRDGVIVAGLQLLYRDSLARQSELMELSGRLRVIVMDEAHQATAPTYSHLIDLLQRSAVTAVLGLSATPGRSLRDVNADLALAQFFHRNKVRLEIPGYTNPIDYLIAEGYLAKIDYVRLPYHPSREIRLSPQEQSALSQGFDLPSRILKDLSEDDARNLLIVESTIAEVNRGGKVILFAVSVEHAALLAGVLRLRGIKAACVTSATSDEKRRQIIQRYRETDELTVLTNYGVLTTGFDAPKTNVAVIARPTSSVALYSQMIGRAARGPRAGGNETCRILTVVDKVPGFRSLAEGFEFWDDIWEE